MPKADDYWWYITLSGPAGMEDALSSVAEDSGCIGSLTTNRGDSVDLQAYYRACKDLGEWIKVLHPYLSPLEGVTISDMGKIENRPWHTEWMDAFPPLNVGERLAVMAPWHAGKEDPGRTPVFIYPGSAFGTGYHQSTQAVLTLLERVIKKGDSVADIGCGSAILSIAALKLGASAAYARDLDPAAVAEAQRNALELNGLSRDCFDAAVGDLLKGFEHKVDLLMANILFEPNKELLPDAAGVLNEGGRAVFSGITDAEGEIFKGLLEPNGLRLFDEAHIDGWCGLAAEKI